jgi:hypothetical protein
MIPVKIESLSIVCASFGGPSGALVREASEKQAFHPIPLLKVVFK